MGGEAIANGDDVADWEGGQRLVNAAIESFGDLDVLVNNAGILRDRVLVNMTEEEWDAVVKVHLKGHFVPTRWAAAYWREQARRASTVTANIVNTSSTSGLLGNPGPDELRRRQVGHRHVQRRSARKELSRYGVRSTASRPRPAPASPRPRPGSATSSRRPTTQARSTSGTRRTSRRSSPTSPPRTARSTARRSSCRAAR